MANKERAILVKLLGDATGLSRAGKQGQQTLDGLDRAARTAGFAIRTGALVGAAAVGAIGAAAVTAAADFDTSMREVNTLLGLPAPGFEDLKAQALDLSESIGRVPSDVVPALYQAISAGVPQANVFSFLETANKAAVGGITNLETSVDALTTATNAWASQGLTATDAADVLFTAVKGGKTTFDELAGTIGRVAPLAAAAGVSFDETAAAVATLTTQGFATAEAVTGIRAGIQGLLRPSEDMTAIFQAAGFASAEAAIKQVGMADAMQVVYDATGGNVGQMTQLLGSVEAVNAVLGLTGPNADKMAAQMDLMAERTGAADAAFEEMEKSASRAWERIQAKVQVGLVRLGDRILPWLVEQLDEFGQWWDEHQPQINAALDRIMEGAENFAHTFKRGWEVVYPPLRRVFDFIVDNKPVLITAIGAIGLAVATAFGPVGVATLAITGIITLIGYLRDNWRDVAIDILGFVQKLSNGITDFANYVIDHIGDALEFGINPLLKAASAIGIGDGPIQIAQGGFLDYSNFAPGLIAAIEAGRTPARWNGSTDAADLYPEAVAMEATAEAAHGLTDTLTGGGGGGGGGLSGAMGDAASAVQEANDLIYEAWLKGGNGAVDALNATNAKLDAEWERQKKLAQDAGIAVTDESRKVWEAVEDQARAAREAIQREVQALREEVNKAGVSAADAASARIAELIAQGIDPAAATAAAREEWAAAQATARDEVAKALSEGRIDATTANSLLSGIFNPQGNGGPGTLADQVRNAINGAGPLVQQNVTVNVEDRSPAAISNAVTLAAREGATLAVQEMAT